MSWRDRAVPVQDSLGFSSTPPSATDVPDVFEEPENFNAGIPGELARFGVHALPGAGALAGGALGLLTGPASPYFSPLMAGMGGVAGQWGEHMLAPYVGYQTEQPTMESARNEALMDVTLGGAGALAQRGMQPLAEKSMRIGLRAPPKWNEQWAAQVPGNETPAQFALRTRNVTERGARQYARGASRRELRVTRAAERAGYTIEPRELAERRLARGAQVGARSTPAVRAQIIREESNKADVLLQHRGGGQTPRRAMRPGQAIADYSPTQVRNIKQTAQALSRGKRASELQGLNLNAAPDEMIDLSRSARSALRRLPGVGPATTEAQKAWNLRRMLGRAEATSRTSLPQVLSAIGAFGGGTAFGHGGAPEKLLEGALAGALAHTASSPEAFRRYALILANPAVQRAAQLGPLGAFAAVRPFMPPQSPEEDFKF